MGCSIRTPATAPSSQASCWVTRQGGPVRGHTDRKAHPRSQAAERRLRQHTRLIHVWDTDTETAATRCVRDSDSPGGPGESWMQGSHWALRALSLAHEAGRPCATSWSWLCWHRVRGWCVSPTPRCPDQVFPAHRLS